LITFRLKIRIASQIFVSAIDIPVPDLWIYDRLNQHLVIATSNQSDASNLSISSGEIKLSVLSARLLSRFPILSTTTASASAFVSHGPEEQFPKLLPDSRHFYIP
jgi:hypothetical protein